MDGPELRQTLHGWQIFCIVLTAVIGSGAFVANGEALKMAGPSGLLIAILFIGIIAICTMESLSELVQLFPAPNAIVEYVAHFVDEDLSWLIGFAYWYTYSATFAIQNLAAAKLAQYWGPIQFWQTFTFYFIAPALTLGLNFCGVFWFGVVETIGGLLKIGLILGTSFLLYAIAAQKNYGSASGPINEGFQNDDHFAPDHSQAFCYAVPLVAFSFLGVEIVAVTAFEARKFRDLKWPSQWIAYVVFVFYILCGLGNALCVWWKDPNLPYAYGGLGNSSAIAEPKFVNPPSHSMPIIAAWQAGKESIPGFLNGCLIFSCLSAANTSLYAASRTLYGLARKVDDSTWIGGKFSGLATVESRNGVPIKALIISALAFFWLPFLQLKRAYGIELLTSIMGVTSSVSCLIVWGALNLSFINYERWLRKCKDEIQHNYPQYQRDSTTYRYGTLFRSLQPWPAYAGLLGCVVVISFASATWWNSPADPEKIAVAFAAPIVLLFLWIVTKLIGRRPLVIPGRNISPLIHRIRELERWAKRDSPTNVQLPHGAIQLHPGGSARGTESPFPSGDTPSPEPRSSKPLQVFIRMIGLKRS